MNPQKGTTMEPMGSLHCSSLFGLLYRIRSWKWLNRKQELQWRLQAGLRVLPDPTSRNLITWIRVGYLVVT